MEKFNSEHEYSCDECGEQNKIVVQLGEPDDWDSRTVLLCEGCLKKALDLIRN